MHDAFIGIRTTLTDFQVFQVTSHIVGLVVLCAQIPIHLLSMHQTYSLSTCTRIPCRGSRCEEWTCEVLSLHYLLLPDVPHNHNGYISFSVSAPQLPRGISASQELSLVSTVFQTLDAVSLLKFLVVFFFTQLPTPLGLRLPPKQSHSHHLHSRFFHIVQAVNTGFFINLLLLFFCLRWHF